MHTLIYDALEKRKNFPDNSMVRLFRVPILIFNPAQIEVISATSSLSSDIMGDAPQAITILAQSFTVTKFVMHWTSGVLFRTCLSGDVKSIIVSS